MQKEKVPEKKGAFFGLFDFGCVSCTETPKDEIRRTIKHNRTQST